MSKRARKVRVTNHSSATSLHIFWFVENSWYLCWICIIDCRLCDRRRVKCDRSLPTCKKCSKKGLVCPGYGLILQWDQGVASRGNLAGMRIPVLPQVKKGRSPAKGPHLACVATDPPNADSVSKLPYQPASTTTEENQLIPFDSSSHILTPHDEVVLGRSLSSFSSSLLENQTVRFFLHHYDHTLAANMAWADCEDNPWRSVMMPMAIQSPPLLFSILAFAAKHMSAMATSASAHDIASEAGRYSRRFGRRALELLAQELRPSSNDDISASIIHGKRRNSSNAILAAMLVLCNVETVWPGKILIPSSMHFLT